MECGASSDPARVKGEGHRLLPCPERPTSRFLAIAVSVRHHRGPVAGGKSAKSGA